jgi:hypothetical protein
MRVLTNSELRFVAGGTDTVDDVVVTGPRKETMTQDEIQQIIDSLDNGGGSGQSGGGGGVSGGLLGSIFHWLTGDAGNAIKSWLESLGDSATDLAKRDDASTFNRSQVQAWSDSNGNQGYIASDGSLWLDRNGNGQPETHVQWINGELWQDTDFNGTWDRRVR